MEILEFKDVKAPPDPIHAYPDSIKNSRVPLIIDNGSYNCRVGWATSDKPLLVFKNVLAKPRKERGKKDGEMQVGNEIQNIEAVRFNLKTQFDRNVVTNCEVQEHIFNYVFSHLGITTETVNHPIVMTEALLNPNYSRSCMSELLFECYGVPSICYGVDSLFSLSETMGEELTSQTCLLLSTGYQSTQVIPVVAGRPDFKTSRRLELGGCQLIAFLHRLLQLKYPAHVNAITLSRSEEILHEHCWIAENYLGELRKWSEAEFYEEHVRCFQLPYASSSSGGSLQGGLSAEQQKERRRELARRLIEINARKREEKLAEDEETLNQLLAIQDLQDEGEETEFQDALAEFGLSSGDELPKMIGQIQARIEKTKQKIVAANTSEDLITEEPKQKVAKLQTPKGEEDFKAWIENVRKTREELLEKKAVRRQRRADMAKRRTLASVQRMRLISQLARHEKKDDDFGTRDEDWDVYKAINKEGGDTDSEGETEKLQELERVLKAHDPTFSNEGLEAPGEAHRLHVGIERIRAPELLFQPYMFGCGQMGLAELVEFVLRSVGPEVATELCKDVVITGGLANLPGFRERMLAEITMIRPFKSEISVRVVENPSLSSWLGMRRLGRNNGWLRSASISRSEYSEKGGGELLREHSASNPYSPSPAPPLLLYPAAPAPGGEAALAGGGVVEELEVELI